jgi:hypothetical protein
MKSNQNYFKKNEEVNLVEESLNQPNKGLRILKILIGIVVVTILFFIGKSFMKDVVPSEKSFSIKQQLSIIEGEWYDPTGVVLGDKKTIAVFKKMGDIVKGKDKNNFFNVVITPFGSNNYQAIVNLGGVKGDFELHFYEQENKLVFFSTYTKSSWYLLKLKK